MAKSYYYSNGYRHGYAGQPCDVTRAYTADDRDYLAGHAAGVARRAQDDAAAKARARAAAAARTR